MYREWANLIVTGHVEVRAADPTTVPTSGGRAATSMPCAPTRSWPVRRLVVHHEPINDIFSAAIGNYGFLLRSPELAPIEAARGDPPAEVIRDARRAAQLAQRSAGTPHGPHVYGHYGQPVVAFPSQDGRFFDFEGFAWSSCRT